MWLFLKALFSKKKRNKNFLKGPHNTQKENRGHRAKKIPKDEVGQKKHPEEEPLVLGEKSPVTAERKKLIQKAMALHREQQKMLTSLTGEQRQNRLFCAHFFLFKGLQRIRNNIIISCPKPVIEYDGGLRSQLSIHALGMSDPNGRPEW